MSKRDWILFAAIGSLVLLADILSKYYVTRGYWVGDYFGGVLRITLVNNPGAAFGLFAGGRPAFIVIKIFALLAILALLWRKTFSSAMVIPLAFIFGGALGNLIDRLRDTGEVIDFIDLGLGSVRWYVFNVADACIVVGAMLLLVLLLLRPARSQPVVEA